MSHFLVHSKLVDPTLQPPIHRNEMELSSHITRSMKWLSELTMKSTHTRAQMRTYLVVELGRHPLQLGLLGSRSLLGLLHSCSRRGGP